MKKLVYVTISILATLLIDSPFQVGARPTMNEDRWQAMDVLATAYCPCRKCCGDFADGKTAIGYDAYAKGVAVDRRLIPLRSKVNIPGYGTVVADDVGGAIKDNRIDVRFPSHNAALEWGRKKVTIYFKTPEE